ncbi:hypothetical protein QTO34_013082 [Cnephaeus nilssonii]|uniref:Peptidase A2 domain-containing protein n=1 Tax=Cnephaeus nilssonii TaxID=3371016 RepID=A0AA40HAM1_CNENI|nr:hypothetical protein QTO34_013082 [Eptesicus nilssonii]
MLELAEDWRCQDSTTPITLAEPRVMLKVAGKQISFLIDMGATFSVLPSFAGPLLPSTILVMGIDGKSTCPLATGPLPCLLDDSPITHLFLVMPSCPVPLLGQDILGKLGATLQLTWRPSASLLLLLLSPSLYGNADPPLPASLINPKVWDTSTPVVPRHHTPVRIRLKDPTSFPSCPQFPISLTHCQGLKPLITRLLGQGLLIPIHPVVPNPYTLLSHIPSGTTHFSILDLKDAFFTIPLDPSSYHLFAFTWEDQMSRYPANSPGRFCPRGSETALPRDLRQCSLEPSTLLQYVDDLLLCSPSLDNSQRQTAGLLNFLWTKDTILSFIGLVGFFRHCIPNFALLAKPLYQAAKETPVAPSPHPPLFTKLFLSSRMPFWHLPLSLSWTSLSLSNYLLMKDRE